MTFVSSIIFDGYYRNFQVKKINNIVRELNLSHQDTYILAEDLAYENEVCINVISNNGVVYNYNTKQRGCLLNKNNTYVNEKINKFLKSSENSDYYYLFNPDTKTKGILYGFKLENKNVFIYSNLENIPYLT